MSQKKNIWDFYQIKKEKEIIIWLTVYNYPVANFTEACGIDMLLVETP